MKVLIIPDKFKGTLAATAAAEAIAAGWQKTRPHDFLRLLPMTDGGDGFGEGFSSLLHAREQNVTTVDAAHRPCESRWWWEARTKTAIIDSAAVIGLAMLPPGRFHPFELDSLGLGTVLRAASAKGAKRYLVGIGGSATNDAGFGVARALGWRFLDDDDCPIERWIDLETLERIQRPKHPLSTGLLQVAVDVQNPLLGRRGATRVYGPQKGLQPKDFELAERCFRRLALVVKKQFGRDFAREPGAGAAGGLGFGLRAFLGARLVPGFDLFARRANLQKHLRWADFVVTGEGSIDDSTFMGKGVGEIARRCRELQIPCLGIGGIVAGRNRLRGWFTQVRALTELATLQQAKAKPALWTARLASDCAQQVTFQIAI